MAATNALAATLLTMAGQRNVITIPRPFVEFTGSIEAAMLLNQLLYWVPRGHSESSIFKTDKEWQDELCLTRYAVRQARERLGAMGFLTTRVQRARGAPTVHYFLDYDKLVEIWTEWLKSDDLLSENEQSDYPKTNNPLSENEQWIVSKSNNESVRNRTNMNNRLSKTITETPPPPPNPPTQGGGGDDSKIQKPTKTELYHWLRANGVDSPDAAERNQHHDLTATQAMHRRMVGDATGDERRKRIGRFIKALDADGPPPIGLGTPAVYTPPARRSEQALPRAEQAARARALMQQIEDKKRL